MKDYKPITHCTVPKHGTWCIVAEEKDGSWDKRRLARWRRQKAKKDIRNEIGFE